MIANSVLSGAVRSSGYAEPLYKLANTNNYVAYTGSGIQVEPGATGWTLFQTDGSKENYDTNGRLVSLVDKAGNFTLLSYDATIGNLIQVSDSFGHTLTFAYDATGKFITSITNNAGQVVSYSYMGSNLTRVTHADGTYRTYVYENASFPNHLTGIIDENNRRFATYGYDSIGRAISTEHAGGSEKVTLQFNSTGTTTVTDAVGNQEVFTFGVNGPGIRDVTGVAKEGTTSSNVYTILSGNPQHRVTKSTDVLGRITTFTYDTHHLISKTEASGTAQARTTTYQYLSEYSNLPTLITTPSVYTSYNKTKSITYGATQLPAQITESGYTPTGTAVTRAVAMQYDSLGHVTQIDGPRTDVSDITTFEYYANDATQGSNRGQLKRVTNALGQAMTYDAYDGNGRLLQTTDANGLRTQYVYDARGRVTSLTKTPATGIARVTSYTYDAVGQLNTATTPDGIVTSYAYDDAHHLTSVTDNLGNKVQYSYDLKGRRTTNATYDPNGTLVRSIDTAYDAWDRVNSVNNGGSVTKSVFDAVGELVTETNPKNANTTHQYDALARMLKTVDALSGNTGYSYDVNDRVTQVTAPNNAATQYTYDDLGRLIKEVSPDRGTTTYSYDAAGNLVSMTDARNVTTTHTYDALNRVKTVTYPTSAENISYTYDSGTGCANGIGKLCGVSDASGTTSYGYDAFGNVTSQVHTELAVTYTTAYTYDAGDRVLSITYPDGRVVSYTRDAIGRVASIATTINGVTTTLTNARSYSADGSLRGQTYGNGKVESRTYDLQGRLTQLTVGTDTRSYSYDANGNVTQRIAATETGNYTYDGLDRLTADNNGTNTTFGYDANGNRTLLGSTAYTYTLNTNRLASVGGTALTLDAAGNTLTNGTYTYSYNGMGQLAQVTSSGAIVGTYTYNANRQRTRKDGGTTPTVYHHDLQGRVIAETSGTGSLKALYIYDDNAPLAQVTRSGGTDIPVYLHTDHLTAPRSATNATGTIVWRWDGKAFGDTAPNQDADGDTVNTLINLRYPGQYYDAESGLFYNWNRYYDAKTGRYISSDPIGLRGGLNSYAYAVSNPAKFFDWSGLEIQGEWIEEPHATQQGYYLNGWNILNPMDWSVGIDGYLKAVNVNATIYGYVAASVRCKDDCAGKEWTMGREFPISYSGSFTTGPNMYVLGGSVALGLVAPELLIARIGIAISANVGAAEIKALYGISSLEQKYQARLNQILGPLNSAGPTYICKKGWPNIQ